MSSSSIVLVIAASAMKGSGRLTSFLGAVMWKTGGFGGLGHLPGDITVKKGGAGFDPATLRDWPGHESALRAAAQRRSRAKAHA